MLINSFSFLIFFVIVFLIYYFPLKEKTRSQNTFLLLASYFFYGYADAKMLSLLVLSTVAFYFIGFRVDTDDERKSNIWKTAGVVLGVGLLLYFKYLNFFIESFAVLLGSLGLKTNWHSFDIILPLGISFFTFRLISYVIEIDRGHMHATKNFIDFALYISFFPCLLSGPIDRPNKFIPQLQKKRSFDYGMAVDGCRQILWGLFKKVVVADNCAVYVDQVWNDVSGNTGSTLALAMILYLFQIYADFSGYSDMAIGVGKLLGFKIADNFKYPLFALNIADYWKKWHITLTSWLTDYVFMPLNIKFRNLGKVGIILAVLINFLIIGLWHGANWTFVLFGLYHGVLYIPLILTGQMNKKSKIRTTKLDLPAFPDFCKMCLTMFLVMLGLVIFRAPSIGEAIQYLGGMCQLGTFNCVHRFFYELGMSPSNWVVLFMIVVEWINRKRRHGLDTSFFGIKSLRWIIYFLLVVSIFLFGGQPTEYIYFQF